jgi:hypothetical protein
VGRFLKAKLNERGVWKLGAHGGGGLVIKVQTSSDGTVVCSTDVCGAYVFNTATQQWDNITHPIRCQYTRQKGITRMDGVSDIAISWSDSNRIYFFNSVEGSVRQGRVYRSDNKGVTCFPTNYIYEGGAGGTELEGNDSTNKIPDGKLAVDPNDPDTVYAAYPGAPPVRSFDAGVTWTAVPNLPTGTNIGTVFIQFDPSSALISGRASIIYCTIWGTGVYRSADAGATWTQISSDVIAPHRNSDIDPNGRYYIGHTIAGANRISRYTHGVGWEDVRSGGGVNFVIACHKTDPDKLASMGSIGQTFHYTSTGTSAGGGTWSTHLKAAQTYTCPYADWLADRAAILGGSIIDMAWAGNDLWVCVGQGIAKITNMVATGSGAPTLEYIVKGIEELVLLQIVHPGPGKQLLYGGMDEGAWKRDTTTIALDTPPNGNQLVFGVTTDLIRTWQVRPDPQALDTILFINSASVTTLSGYSDDAGATFNVFANQHPQNGTEYGTAAINDGVILWSTNSSTDSRPYRSADLGATAWTQITNGGAWTAGNLLTGWHHSLQQLATTIVADTVNPDKWYIFNYLRNTCFRSSDRGLTFTEGSVTGYGDVGQYVRTAVQPFGYEDHLWISNGPNTTTTLPPYSTNAANTLRRSTNGGDTWTTFSSDILDPYRFGFGKARAPGEYPTLFIECCFKRIYGIWRFDNADATTATRLLCSDGDFFPAHSNAEVRWIDGDKDVYGRCYVALGQQGFAYYDRA